MFENGKREAKSDNTLKLVSQYDPMCISDSKENMNFCLTYGHVWKVCHLSRKTPFICDVFSLIEISKAFSIADAKVVIVMESFEELWHYKPKGTQAYQTKQNFKACNSKLRHTT